MITIDNVHKNFGNSHVLKGISFTVPQGQSILFRGDNGSGKSTLLRVICGLLRPTSGQVQWADGYKKEEQRTIGYVVERFPQMNLTPLEYLQSMGRIQGMPEPDLEQQIQEMMSLFRMEAYMGKRMNEFSKGMLQKINIIQAVLRKPDLLILDEPLSGLDVDAQRELRHLLGTLHREGTALMMVCHESKLLDALADRIITLDFGQVIADETLEQDDKERRLKLLETEVCIRIACSQVNEKLYRCLSAHEAVLSVEEDRSCLLLDVHEASSDELLRMILDKGGSIISVRQVIVDGSEKEESLCASH